MNGSKPLSGKVALVTGASRGVGKAVALDLADRGADIVVTARTVNPRSDIAGTIVQTVSDIQGRGATAVSNQADLLDPQDVRRLAAQTLDRFGKVDILVNNAAFIGDEVFQSFWEMSAAAWREQFDLNVNVQFALMKHFAPSMREHGKGLIVNLGSGNGNVPTGDPPLPRKGGLGPSYPTTKAAIVHMTKWVGNELRHDGITVVCVGPGYARSESAELLSAKMGIDVNNAQPVEVAARAVGYLATCPDPLQYAGMYLESADFLANLGIPSP
jgi:NAD(P)-dependent dehydrogenase (short-subunit alcohol dehydrogenase family)